jgi:hypothetical protein
VKNYYGTEEEARALNGLEEPLRKKNWTKSLFNETLNVQFSPVVSLLFQNVLLSILKRFS